MQISPKLWYRASNCTVIAILDIIFAGWSILLYGWHLLVKISTYSHAIDLGAQLGVIVALFVFILVALCQLIVARNLILHTNKICEYPKRTLQGCSLWRKYSVFLLLISFFYLALHFQFGDYKEEQLYPISLIVEIAFRIFSLGYVSLLIRDLAAVIPPSSKVKDIVHIYSDGESQNTTIIQMSDGSEEPTSNEN